MIDEEILGIPDDDHIARYCPQSKMSEDGDRPLPSAFLLRKQKNESYLSVNWLEILGPDRPKQLTAVNKIISNKGFIFKKKDSFSVLNVGFTINYVENYTPDKRKLKISHQPKHNDKSYSGIFNTNHSSNELVVATAISESVKEVHPTTELLR